MKNINHLDPPPPLPPPPPPVSGSIPPWSIPPPRQWLSVQQSRFARFGLGATNFYMFHRFVFSVNVYHLARIFAHAACRTQRCFETASDASRCSFFKVCHATMCVCVSHPTNLAGPLVVHKLPMNPLCHRPISCNNC